MSWFNSMFAAAAPAVKGAVRKGLTLVSAPAPKLKPNQQTIPSYLTTATPSTDSLLNRIDRTLASTDIETYRVGADSRQVLRDFAAASPDLSAAVNAFLRTAITPHYTAICRNAADGVFNREGTALLQQLLARFDILGTYADGFSGINTMRSNSESLGKEILLYGACALELVLGKDRLPQALQPISVPWIFFYPDKTGKRLRPVQRLGGVEIDLDLPSVFYTALDQNLLDAYASSPLESALQPVLFSAEFLNDLRRVVKRAIHPRMTVEINEEKLRKNIAPDVAADPAKLQAFLDGVIADAKTKMDGLRPEETLVYYDSIKFALLTAQQSTTDKDYTVLSGIVDSKLSTGAKTLPSILGHGSGSQSIAGAEVAIFMRNADGIIRQKLNEIYSSALTLAVRLFGLDVYVDFQYDEINLRPAVELEAFRAMKQSRVLEQLSLGLISDDDACMQITGQLTPAGYKPLSGTGFQKPVAANPNQNPYNGSGAGGGGGGGGAPIQQNNPPPSQPKGPPKKAEDEVPALTAEAVADVVVARLPAVPEPVAAALTDLEPLRKGIVDELYAIAGALNEDGITREARAKAAAAEQAESIRVLSEKVSAISDKELPAVIEPQPINITVVNEAAKPGKKVAVGSRDPKTGELTVVMSEVPDAS